MTAYLVLSAVIGALKWLRPRLCATCRAEVDEELSSLESQL